MTETTSTVSLAFGDLLRGVDLSSTVAAIQSVIKDPTENSTLSIALLAVVVLAVLLLAVFVLMLVTPSRKKVVKVRRYTGGRPEGAEAGTATGMRVVQSAPRRRAPSKLFMALTGPVAVAALVILAFVGTYVLTSTDAYCAKTCHGSTDAAESGTEVDHARCVSCHGTEGLLGVFANISDRTRMLVRYSAGVSPRRATVAVDSYVCLRCHGDIRTETIASKSGLVMSHEEVIQGGEPCTECHAESGHARARFTASMSACVTCHDSRTASAECQTCHSRDTTSISFAAAKSTESMGTGAILYPAVRAANRNCGACHEQETECDYCHRLRMPHTTEFKEGGHAVAAAFERKRVCWQCHDPQVECGKCHIAAFDPITGNTAHGVNWEQEHKQAAWNSGCGCHYDRGAASGRTGPMCYLCHAPDHSVLPVTQ